MSRFAASITINPADGKIENGHTSKTSMWMPDTDYDTRNPYPPQVYFPMTGVKDGRSRLARTLEAGIDEELIEAYRGMMSLPSAPGDRKRGAIRIIDDRGIKRLKIVEVA